MKRTDRLWPACMLAVMALTTPAPLNAAPPEVLYALPDHGDHAVDPELKEIRIFFDQDMSQRGYSICGGGPLFPAMDGRPRWEDARTFVLRVRLKPEQDYRFSVNCQAAENFKNALGESATAYPIHFRTAARGSARPSRLKRGDNHAAVKVLRAAIDRDYAYRHRRGVDWDRAFASARPKLEKAPTAAAFARAAAKLLEPARDPHVWLQVGDAVFGSHVCQFQPNYELTRLRSVVPEWKENRCAAAGRFADGVRYILIKSWQSDCREDLELAFQTVSEFGDGARGLIVDVRPNSGGDEALAREFAGCFVQRPGVYGRHVLRDADRAGGFSEPFERVVQPSRGRPRYRGRIVLIIGPAVMSSCESFVRMMQQVRGCTTMGAPTYGSSGNPKPHPLPNGVTIHLPSWQDLLPDGSLLEGHGLKPDVPVTWEPKPGQDPLIHAALKRLRK